MSKLINDFKEKHKRYLNSANELNEITEYAVKNRRKLKNKIVEGKKEELSPRDIQRGILLVLLFITIIATAVAFTVLGTTIMKQITVEKIIDNTVYIDNSTHTENFIDRTVTEKPVIKQEINVDKKGKCMYIEPRNGTNEIRLYCPEWLQ